MNAGVRLVSYFWLVPCLVTSVRFVVAARSIVYMRHLHAIMVGRPEQLRPLLVLQKTTRYLVKDVFTKACIEDGGPLHDSKRVDTQVISTTAKAYGFVEDRLRSVRQDLIVQGLGAAVEALEVLKIAANFYVVAGYLMSDQVRIVSGCGLPHLTVGLVKGFASGVRCPVSGVQYLSLGQMSV